jgi:hypothetical protein
LLGAIINGAEVRVVRLAMVRPARPKISELFCRYKTAAQISTALGFLAKHGYARYDLSRPAAPPIEP